MKGSIEVRQEEGFLGSTLAVPEKSNLGEFLAVMHQNAKEAENDRLRGEVVLPRAEKADHFITVAIRTQGKRIQELEEGLLCLCAQTFLDFDVCIVGHNIHGKDEEVVLELIGMQPKWLRDKIEYSRIEGGSRSRPLNLAFSRSRSDYITILDDDDLVFDNWLQTFYECALSNWGRIIYSYVFTQDWRVVTSGDGSRLPESTKAPKATYCEGYDFAMQLDTNHCPIMGLAYPRYAYSEFGVRFDESLTTTEDWDYLLRAAKLCGVANTLEATSIYRLWKNAENSASLHKKIEWDKNRDRVIQKIASEPYLFPASGVEELLSYITSGTARFNGLERIKLAYKDQKGWHSECRYPDALSFDVATEKNTAEFTGLEVLGEVERINVCFRDKGLLTIQDAVVTVTDVVGDVREYDFFTMESHGVLYDDPDSGEEKIAFLGSSPHFAIGFEGHPIIISSIKVEFLYKEGVHERLLTGTKLLVRVKQTLKRMKRRLRRKDRR